MEWVETTGSSLAEATEVALDQLGVDEADADVEVLEEPRQGMFGRVRGAARVRARIRPSAPRAKEDRQRKRRKGSRNDAPGATEATAGEAVTDPSDTSAIGTARRADASGKASGNGDRSSKGGASGKGARAGRGSGGTQAGGTDKGSSGSTNAEREVMPEQEQRSVGETFLDGVLESMGLDASVSSALHDDGILSFDIEGDRLGLLIGPGLKTMDSIQEVCRNCIQRHADGREWGKVVLDVSGVRRARTAALEDFVRTEAAKVTDTGEDVVFEVMSRSDRKIVHDVVTDLDGVSTESVGEDPRRRVVLKSA